MIPAGAYYRMSTDDQATSVPGQRSAVMPFAAEHGFQIVAEYIDEGISGDATEKRKEFQRMIADAVAGKIKAILCWDQDRFGRFDSIEAGYWIHPLRKAGVRLVTVNEGTINWDDFTGRVMYSLKQEGKHQYLRDLSRNTMRGMLQKAQQGLWVCGPPPLGYVVGDDMRLRLGERHDVEAVRSLFEGYLSGHSLRTLTEAMNAKGLQTARGNPFHYVAVRFILKNRNYTGDMIWNVRTESKYNSIRGGRVDSKARGSKLTDQADWVVTPGAHPPIVSLEEFEAVQERLRSHRPSTPLKAGGLYVLSGLLRCAKCGSAMSGNTYSGIPYYVCSAYFHRGASFCQRNAVRQDELLGNVAGAIEADYLSPQTVKAMRQQMKGDAAKAASSAGLEAAESRLSQVRRELEQAERNMALTDNDFLRQRYERIVIDLAGREQQLSTTLEAAKRPKNAIFQEMEERLDLAIGLLSSLRDAVKSAEPRLIREALHAIVERVDVEVRDEPREQRKRFFLVGGKITMRELNLFQDGPFSKHVKRVIEFRAKAG